MNEYIARGETFLKNCLFDGLAHSYDTVKRLYVKPYPEVTGYVIKYFCDQNQVTEQITSAADYLLSIQDPDSGGFSSFYQTEFLYAFDTAQILTGLASLYEKTGTEKYLLSAMRAGRFLSNMQTYCGGIMPIFDRRCKEKLLDARTYQIWNGPFSGLMCKITEAYSALYQISKDGQWEQKKQVIADFYEGVSHIEHSHPLGYWLEGLWNAGRYSTVKNILDEKVIPRIQKNGYISYTPMTEYAYVSGTIQLGIILYKAGYVEQSLQIRNYGRLVQSKSETGGLFQYAKEDGKQDNTIHTEINSWGTKYFCELERLLSSKSSKE